MSNDFNSTLSGVERQLDQRIVELQSLFEMSRILNSSLQLHSILNNLLLTPMGRMMITRGFVMVRQENDEFELLSLKGLPRDALHATLTLNHDLPDPVLTTDLPDSLVVLREFLQHRRIELILPIRNDSRLTGLIGLGKKNGDRAFADSEIEYLNSLCNIAATAVQNALMFKELETVNRQLDKKVQELNTLFEIGKELNSTLDEEKILSMLLYAVMGEMVVHRCIVLLKKDAKLHLAAHRGSQLLPLDPEQVEFSQLREKLTVLAHPVVADRQNNTGEWAQLIDWGIDLVIPMRIQSQTRGVLLVGQKINRQPFGEDEIDFLFTLANRAMISLENARLFQQAIEKQKIEDELSLARDIQQRMLPRENPHIKGVEIAGLNIPSRQVGGDYFDWIPLENGRIACVIADVSGKGVGASLLMSNIQASIHSLITNYTDRAKMIAKINNLIHARTSYDKFITLFFIEIDPSRMQATFVNAGHNPPYLLRMDGSIRTLDEGGLIIGMMQDALYRSETISLQKGDLILMFTDGVTEARNQSDEEFEEKGVETFLISHQHLPVQEIIDRLLSQVRAFASPGTLPDDLTVLGVRII